MRSSLPKCLVFAGIAVFAWKAGGLSAAAAAERPNILLITTDQQRVDAASCVGNRWCKTPNIDSIAASGVYFTRSYSPYPLCSPARSALHTGRTPHEIRVDRNSVPIDPTILLSGQVFREAGYDTGYAGKWHMPDPYPRGGIAGFEVLNTTTRTGKLAHEVDEATLHAAVAFLKRPRDKAFYLTVSFINPHDICLLAGDSKQLVDEVWKRYQPSGDAELPPLPAAFRGTEGEPDLLAKRRSHAAWDETQWRRYRYAYFRMVEDVDQQIGEVLKALRNTGEENNTLIVFTSDHGEGLGARHWTGKMMFYDDEAAVPLIVSWKGKTPKGRIDREHLVSALDVLPTVCDYAGLKPPPKMRGQSVREIIENPAATGHDFVASEMATGGLGGRDRSFMIRTTGHKYMSFSAADGARIETLFDLEADPEELKNIAGTPAAASEVVRHRELLARWKQQTDEDQYPVSPIGKKVRKRARSKG